MLRPLQLAIESDDFAADGLAVVRVDGREAVSELYAFDVLVVSRDNSVDLEALVGARARLVVSRDGEEVRKIHGWIAAAHDRHDAEVDHVSFSIRLVPRAHALTLLETCDVFLDMNIPDILRSKLDALGWKEGDDYELRLADDYPERDFVVQYKESDLAFVSRLTEHLGMSFFFEQRDACEVMVFTDHNDGFARLPGKVPYRGRGERHDVFRLEESVRLVPGQVVVRDYNYRTPQLTLTGQANLPGQPGGVVEYGPHVKTPDEAKKMATVRTQELLAARHRYEGESDRAGLFAGVHLELEGHPRGELDLLLVEVTLTVHQPASAGGGGQGPEFHVHFVAVKCARPFRPARKTPRPRIHGVVTALVDASDKGDYAEIDDQGRYKVKFLFDTTDPADGKGSRLVRMAQPHAGQGYGMHFPLRPGIEVLLTFVDGDPDRPIIAATVPNPVTASPVTSDNGTKNILRTGSGNEIHMEDKKDNERIKLSTPHKATSFQLGSPNSPERGAMLETQGASSTVAFAGVAGFSSIKSAVNVIGELREGGNITAIAEKPKIAETVSRVAELMSSILEIASSTVEATNGVFELMVARKKQAAIEAQVKAKNAHEAAEKKQEEAKAKLDALLAAHPELADKVAALDAARAKYDADVLDKRTNQEFYRDAKKGEAAGTYTAETQYYEGAIANDDLAINGDPSGTDDATKNGSKKTLEDAQAELDAALAAYPADDADVEAYADAQKEAEEAEKADDEAWDEASEAKETYDKAVEEQELGETAQDLKQASIALAAAKEAFVLGTLLFSVCMQVYTLIKWIYQRVKGIAKKAEAVETAMAGLPRNPFAPTAFKESKYTHTIGSDGNTLVYAEKNMFLWADTAALLADKTLIAAKDQLELVSPDKIEISATKELKATGGKVIDVLSRGTLTVEAVKTAMFRSSDVLTVQSLLKDVKIAAKGPTQKILVDAGSIELTAVQTAKVLSKGWGLTVDGLGKSVKLGGAAWNLSIKDNAVKLGGPQSAVTLGASRAMVQKGQSWVQLTDAQATLKGTAISVKGVNVTVEGDATVQIKANGMVKLG